MAWTNIPDVDVEAGGIPKGSTITALRDNPIAIAEGAVGAPAIELPAIQAALGDVSFGSVGSYTFARRSSGTNTSAGTTVAGSDLLTTTAARQVLNTSSGAFGSSGGLSGTWRAMANYDDTATGSVAGSVVNVMTGATLWLRIS